MTKVAKCCCGSLSVEVKDNPEIFGICHCENCKARTGSAFGMSAYFSLEDVIDIAGKSKIYGLHNPHKNHDQKRHFCAECGTTLFWYISDLPNMIGVAGGCFNSSDLGEPSFSATSENMCSWVNINSSVKSIA